MDKQYYIRLALVIRKIKTSPAGVDAMKSTDSLMNITADLFAIDFPTQGRDAFIRACEPLNKFDMENI
jgi:hypothetical protein